MAQILVIDDDHDMRTTMRRILTQNGHTVVEADNGVLASRLVAAERPALVITDLSMPGKDGFETLQELKKAWPDLRVIAVTGGGQYYGFNYLDAARAMGADALLQKPFRVAEFMTTVERLLPPGVAPIRAVR